MSPDVGLDRLVETLQRDLQRGLAAADEASARVDTSGTTPFAVTDVELVVPFESTVTDADGETAVLLGVGAGEGRLTLRYRPVPAEELVRVAERDGDSRGLRLAETLRPLTAEAARALVDAGLETAEDVATADPGRVGKALRGTGVDAALVSRTAALAALGAAPVTAELLAREEVTPKTLRHEGPGATFDRLRRSAEDHGERVPPDYRVDYAEIDALVAAAE